MLDADISTEDTIRLLSAPSPDAPGPGGWTRRTFLQAVGLGVIGGTALGPLGGELVGSGVRDPFAGPPIGTNDGVLVTIMLYGGNDGLNTVVPYTNGRYYDQRADLAIAPETCLPLDDTYAWNPNLPTLRSLYDTGQVAIIHGVGYDRPDLSHFTSTAIWFAGRFNANPGPPNGWIGRWLDGLPGQPDLAVATVGTSVPLHLVGAVRRGIAVPTQSVLLGTAADAPMINVEDGLKQMAAAPAGNGNLHAQIASTLSSTVDVGRQLSSVYPLAPASELVQKLTMAARLINHDVGVRLVDVGRSLFDTHASQPGMHAYLLAELDQGLSAFYATLLPKFRTRVTVMTMSEFGRTPWSNLSQGTDHGTANVQFVIGPSVKGGMYGEAPPFDYIDANDRLISTVDFRSVFGSVIDGWLGGGGSSVLGGSFENLGLFRNIPGIALPPAGKPPVPIKVSGFVPLTPVRVFDTRDGTGLRDQPLGTAETWSFRLGGRLAVPGEATSVVLNLTATDVAQPTFVTGWNAGSPQPPTSNLNPKPGASTPNLVIGRLGTRGEVSFYNAYGDVNLIADLVGYFHPSESRGLVPLTPARLLDTRATGLAVGPGASIELVVAGRGGVIADSQAVALNVTVTQPTAPSYLTIWPTGEPMPLASSVNMMPNQTVPNMVVARVGAGGKISIFNAYGNTHVIVDVLGCFPAAGGGRFVPIQPDRLLDTRSGIGAPVAPVTSQPLRLQVTGRGNVPATATAVVLNVTAVTPTTPTFVTVYPSGSTPPTASNLNALPGEVIPNMVLATLGGDGAVMLLNGYGGIDLLADVMGYFIP